MTADSDSTRAKHCTKCGERKTLTEFHTYKRAKDGRTSSCKACISAGSKKFRADNAEKIAASRKMFREANAEKIAAANKAWYAANTELANSFKKAWRKNNPDESRAKAREYIRSRRESDPVFSIKERMNRAICRSLLGIGHIKQSRSHEILGCEFDAFKTHLERQFAKGMSWENRSEWHIDHIVPISSAKTEADVIALSHFTNLRPLWAKDNIAKRDTATHLI